LVTAPTPQLTQVCEARPGHAPKAIGALPASTSDGINRIPRAQSVALMAVHRYGARHGDAFRHRFALLVPLVPPGGLSARIERDLKPPDPRRLSSI
jgi:hypothetical protein